MLDLSAFISADKSKSPRHDSLCSTYRTGMHILAVSCSQMETLIELSTRQTTLHICTKDKHKEKKKETNKHTPIALACSAALEPCRH